MQCAGIRWMPLDPWLVSSSGGALAAVIKSGTSGPSSLLGCFRVLFLSNTAGAEGLGSAATWK